MHQKGDHEAN